VNICDSGEKAGKNTLYFLVQQRFTYQFSGRRESRKMKNNMDESGVFARAPNTSRSPGSILRGQKCLFIILTEELPRHFF
jgi:hypothetical protein